MRRAGGARTAIRSPRRVRQMQNRPAFRTLLPVALLVALAACEREGGAAAAGGGAPQLVSDGRLAVAVVVPEGAGPGLRAAAEDLREAMARIGGVEISEDTGYAAAVVEARAGQDDPELGGEGYRIDHWQSIDGRPGLVVSARTETGAMYGLYAVAEALGVQYIHPEETFYPSDPGARLPWSFEGKAQVPAFKVRGFHEHTQHPIPLSDYLLRPGVDGFRDAVSRYLRWLARNRQNTLTFHSLNTLDLEKWVPYMKGVIEEANGLGIEVGTMVSFADQQQHAFKLIWDGATHPDTGKPLSEEEQIRGGLDEVLAAGFDIIGFQVGTSEFTTPEPGSVLRWLGTAAEHLEKAHEGVRPVTWIHITCSVRTEDDGYFFHQPLDADPSVGAFVHTTMYYTLVDPAPVYDCEDFSHQLTALEKSHGVRETIFFPETAWWLGFDNNLPLLLPLTAWSREQDLVRVHRDFQADGHVTFTTGREWSYWQYDHYLTRATWDQSLSWDSYLYSIGPVYGSAGGDVLALLGAWTELQKKHFYEENPTIYFYLAGELPQDEAGAKAGVLARRPKIPFNEVYGYDDEAFATWQSRDLDMLERVRADYQALLDALPETTEGTEQQQRLFLELRSAAAIYVWRIEHALALYRGVVSARGEDETAARARLDEARAISAKAKAAILEVESKVYRSPLEVLAREKPESKTAYPFGYLYETSTAYFWTRRDDQLDTLIDRAFSETVEEWSETPEAVFAATPKEVTLTEPKNPVASGVLAGFMPGFLFAQTSYEPASGALTLLLAADQNVNGEPDAGTEQVLAGTLRDGAWTASPDRVVVPVYDSADTLLGQLELSDPVFAASPAVDGAAVTALGVVSLAGDTSSDAFIGMVQSIAGIDRDGIESLIKSVFSLDTAEPLPEKLGVAFDISTKPQE